MAKKHTLKSVVRELLTQAEAEEAAPRPTVHEFEMELTPFSSYQLYGDKKYSLQNMVLKMVDYPAKIDTALDHSFDIYVDRAYTEWGAAARLISSKESGDAWFAGVSDKDFLLFVHGRRDRAERLSLLQQISEPRCGVVRFDGPVGFGQR
jgi:hypothetical protein